MSAAGAPWFRRAVEGRSFAVGEYQVGRIVGKPVVVFARPVLERDGRLRAVVFAALDLASLDRSLVATDLHPGAALTLIDRSGRVLARRPDPEKWVGRSFPDAELVKAVLTHRTGLAEVKGVDGVSRLYAFQPLPGAGDDLFVAAGIPLDVVFAESRENLVRHLAGLAVLGLAAVILAWLASERFIRRPADRMVRVIDRFASGDHGARADLPKSPRELDRIAGVLDTMAETFERRDAQIAATETERTRALEALAHSVEQYRRLFESSPVPMWVYEADTLRFLAVNRAAVATYGYSRDELLAHPGLGGEASPAGERPRRLPGSTDAEPALVAGPRAHESLRGARRSRERAAGDPRPERHEAACAHAG